MNPRGLFLSILLLLFSLPAIAQPGPNELALSLGRWDSDEIGNGSPAVGASYNRFFGQVFSTRLGGYAARQGDFTSGALFLSGEIHLFRAARVSPWVGAGGGYGYVRRAASNDRFVGSETALTGIYSGGVDVTVSPRFAVGADVSYMNYEMSLGNRFGYRVDPVMVSLTGRWRFP